MAMTQEGLIRKKKCIEEQSIKDQFLHSKRQYEECPWWKFKKRKRLHKNCQNAMRLVMKHVK